MISNSYFIFMAVTTLCFVYSLRYRLWETNFIGFIVIVYFFSYIVFQFFYKFNDELFITRSLLIVFIVAYNLYKKKVRSENETILH